MPVTPPASMTERKRGHPPRRFASTQPALPAPTMTWSKVWSMRGMGARACAAVQGGIAGSFLEAQLTRATPAPHAPPPAPATSSAIVAALPPPARSHPAGRSAGGSFPGHSRCRAAGASTRQAPGPIAYSASTRRVRVASGSIVATASSGARASRNASWRHSATPPRRARYSRPGCQAACSVPRRQPRPAARPPRASAAGDGSAARAQAGAIGRDLDGAGRFRLRPARMQAKPPCGTVRSNRDGPDPPSTPPRHGSRAPSPRPP